MSLTTSTWTRLDRGRLRRDWSWRGEIRQQVINTDIDGLLSAALLHHTKGWPVVGFYDTQSLWVAEGVPVPLDLRATVWVDADMCWPGTRCVSQHVVAARQSDAVDVLAYRETVNPNLAVGCHGETFGVYRNKYPYGTFQWLAWIAGEPDPPSPEEELLTGLAWMPDGGFQSVNHPAWRQNCLNWARETLPNSVLAPLARAHRQEATPAVAAAARLLSIEQADRARTWRNHQYVMSDTRRGFETLVDVMRPAGRADVQGVLDRICEVYGWRPIHLPRFDRRFVGTWRGARGALPPGWPQSANDGRVVSFAITGRERYCWTEPKNEFGLPSLADALGAI